MFIWQTFPLKYKLWQLKIKRNASTTTWVHVKNEELLQNNHWLCIVQYFWYSIWSIYIISFMSSKRLRSKLKRKKFDILANLFICFSRFPISSLYAKLRELAAGGSSVFTVQTRVWLSRVSQNASKPFPYTRRRLLEIKQR